MSFSLGIRSRVNLRGVNRDLVRVVEHAIRICTVDFTVIEGLRSRAKQAEYVKAGSSWTMNGRHLTGHAVDVAPYVGGVRFDWPLFFPIAEAFKVASLAEQVPIVWGGTWGLLTDLQSPINVDDLHRGRPDGPHFELQRARYP